MGSVAECLEMDPARTVVAPHLIDVTARTAARLAAGRPLAVLVSVRLAELVTGVTKAMTISKVAIATSLLVFAGLAAGGAAGLVARTPRAHPPARLVQGNSAPTPLAVAANGAASVPSAQATDRRQDQNAHPDPVVPDELPPVVVDIVPKVGATDVDPGLREIRVTFSKKMTDKSWSWTSGNVYATPKRRRRAF